MKIRSILFAPCAALALAGCVSGGGNATQMVSATSGVRGLLQAQEPPSAADYALSCSAVNTRLSNLYSRYETIEAEQRAAQRKQALMGGVLDVGSTLIGANSIMGAGSATGLQNAALATQYGRAALGSVANSESSTQQLKDITDASLLAGRVGQLEKVKFEKGC